MLDVQETTTTTIDDQQWFEQHPKATYRVRDPLLGEFEYLRLFGFHHPSHHKILVQRVGSSADLFASTSVNASIYQNVPPLILEVSHV